MKKLFGLLLLTSMVYVLPNENECESECPKVLDLHEIPIAVRSIELDIEDMEDDIQAVVEEVQEVSQEVKELKKMVTALIKTCEEITKEKSNK